MREENGQAMTSMGYLPVSHSGGVSNIASLSFIHHHVEAMPDVLNPLLLESMLQPCPDDWLDCEAT